MLSIIIINYYGLVKNNRLVPRHGLHHHLLENNKDDVTYLYSARNWFYKHK